MPPKKHPNDTGDNKTPSTWDLEDDKEMTLESLIAEHPFKQSSDESGEGQSIGTRVPAWMLRRIAKFKELPGKPYEVNSDVIRDAIWLGLQILGKRYAMHDWEVDKKLTAVIDATGAMDRINGQVTGLCKNLIKLKQADDTDKAVEHLDEFILSIDTVQLQWHKDTLVKALKKNAIVTELLPRCSHLAQEIMR
jgi:hypothetical protein